MPGNNCQTAQPKSFDLCHSPLAGFNLIDASAGTGKTYTICGLVLRLLLEKGLTIEQILVVTYTEAATEDLRGRIRQKLRQALEAVNTQSFETDAFLQKYLADCTDHRQTAKRLSEALRGFDEAAIFTIHGFCQRMLLENSFESNTLFDTELIVDDSHLIREIAEDFWRRNLSHSSKLFSRYAAEQLAPDALQDFLRPFLPHPFLQFIPELDDAACGQLEGPEAEYVERYKAVCGNWSEARQQVSEDLLHSRALNRAKYRQKSMAAIIAAMDAMAVACQPSLSLFNKFGLLASSSIRSGTKTRERPNILPFYDLCEELAQAGQNLQTLYNNCILALKKRLLYSFRHALAQSKTRDNVFSFDDLLQRLHAALTGPGGYSLARLIEQKYPAALIDEFQDTDQLQFEIFKAIYREESLLFLIGDPKQAIYSFRGADIFTYMDAAAGSPLAHHTLDVNHRSTPGLVKAVNTIFSRAQKPFIYDEIAFQPVSAAESHGPESLTIDGQEQTPFVLWYLERPDNPADDSSSGTDRKKFLTKDSARNRIFSRVAAEVCRLLGLAAANRLLLGDRKFTPGDIAILVRKNDEARKMQQVLTELQVPSVLHSGDDLFASQEARELSLLLNAIAAPGSVRRVKTALLTPFIGLQAETVCRLQPDSPEHEKILEYWLTRCRTYHELWRRHGFIRMFWAVMRENRVRQRVLASENGERSLTNILHLAEILHQETDRSGLHMTALLGYLHERLAENPRHHIEHQLRLESDEARVKIVTIHKAKGLEYPVVFCPFTWDGLRTDGADICLFHSQRQKGKSELVFDAGSPELEHHVQNAREEEMAENLRLFYVALTRAVHRCYLAWGPINGAQTSAPAYLLHQGEEPEKISGTESAPAISLMQRIADRFVRLSDHEILADLHAAATAAAGTIDISPAAAPPPVCFPEKNGKAALLRQREFTGTIAADWKISSFSSLTAGISAQTSERLQDTAGFADRDGMSGIVPAHAVDQDEPRDSSPDIFSFPRGARPGTFLHELLEEADFNSQQPASAHLVCEKLRQFGYETSWYPVIAAMLQDLRHVPLHDDIPGLRLANIPHSGCLHELEFYFPLSRVTPEAIRRLFSRHLPGAVATGAIPLLTEQLDRLIFAPARGYMRGFIDLVFAYEGKFYLLDWKSNFLGAAPADYHREKLAAVVLSGYYFLQYHIYTLALHLYLQERLPRYRYTSHFGGIFYLFLRGVRQSCGPDYGIFFDRPKVATVEALAAELLPGPATLDTSANTENSAT